MSEDFGTLPVLAESFRRSLLAENKSPRTVRHLHDGRLQVRRLLAEQDLSLDVGDVRREHLEGLVASLLDSRARTRRPPTTAH
jgi:hypothetical protein